MLKKKSNNKIRHVSVKAKHSKISKIPEWYKDYTKMDPGTLPDYFSDLNNYVNKNNDARDAKTHLDNLNEFIML